MENTPKAANFMQRSVVMSNTNNEQKERENWKWMKA